MEAAVILLDPEHHVDEVFFLVAGVLVLVDDSVHDPARLAA